MALPIASIPVLTGEVAQRFEAEAQANYEWYLNRSEEEKKAHAEIMEKKFAELPFFKKIMKKVLTTGFWNVILTKLSARETAKPPKNSRQRARKLCTL